MKRNWIATLGLLLALSGCQTVPQSLVMTSRSVSHPVDISVEHNQKAKTETNTSQVRQVAFRQDEALQDSSPSGIPIQDSFNSASEPIVNLVRLQNLDSTRLANLEQVAIATNPAIAEIQAEIESLRGKLTQAGLPPNPKVGVNAEDIFEDGSAGRFGVYFGREVVRGNKLGRSSSVVGAEIEAAEQRLAVVQQRLLTDLRQRYYDLLVSQETVAMTESLVKISDDAVRVSNKLYEAKEVAQTAVLQSELELQNAKVVKRQAENQRLAARRKLAGLLGEAELPLDNNIEGNPRELLALEDFEKSYDQLVNSSPEVATLFAEVEQRRRQLNRAIVEPIPNVTWQTTIQYDTVSDNVIGGLQIGMPIPTLNRNQGAIHQARHQVIAAEHRAEKKALDLRQRLTTAYESYLDAKLQVDAFDSEIIPKAKKTLDLVNKGYQAGEIDFLQLLTAQRTYSQINLTYLQQLQLAWRQNVQIKGMLLTGSLK